ncbi:MAG: 50S ribosomal protein L11 methyltransferase [Alphaproteobacteria bacterium]|nr:50S ribosomal protein L11 methyltransferase [Alphaproteobacteria bacterium]
MNPLWQARLTLPTRLALAAEEALEPYAVGLSRFEARPDGSLWQVEALFDGMPPADLLEPFAREGGLLVRQVAERDWVALSQSELPPITAGRFHLHGSHDARHPLAHMHDLLVDAGQAFGTGRHETTRGCLLMLDRLARHRIRPRRLLDLGCGSGVLALAAARAWRRRVTASDIDPVAVRVARENARLNGEQARLRCFVAPGLQGRHFRDGTRYDLILANILARPLVDLAPALARRLAPGGRLVLSGLLVAQEPAVVNAYRRGGLKLAGRLRLQGWSTLLLERGRNPEGDVQAAVRGRLALAGRPRFSFAGPR